MTSYEEEYPLFPPRCERINMGAAGSHLGTTREAILRMNSTSRGRQSWENHRDLSGKPPSCCGSVMQAFLFPSHRVLPWLPQQANREQRDSCTSIWILPPGSYMWLLLIFYWPKQVTWPHLTSGRWGSTVTHAPRSAGELEITVYTVVPATGSHNVPGTMLNSAHAFHFTATLWRDIINVSNFIGKKTGDQRG